MVVAGGVEMWKLLRSIGDAASDAVGNVSAVAAQACEEVSAVVKEGRITLGAVLRASQTVLNDGGEEASQYRRYRYHRRHRDRIDAGDIIAGAVIIGGIFAIASDRRA